MKLIDNWVSRRCLFCLGLNIMNFLFFDKSKNIPIVIFFWSIAVEILLNNSIWAKEVEQPFLNHIVVHLECYFSL